MGFSKGFLENGFHITQNFVPAITPQNRSGPRLGEASDKTEIGAKSY
jgi:hypothetical protein